MLIAGREFVVQMESNVIVVHPNQNLKNCHYPVLSNSHIVNIKIKIIISLKDSRLLSCSIAAIESLSAYLQCTPPPPPAFDSYPKKCNSTLDCFPNVCCQEAGKKHCRPPRRSLLALVTGFAQVTNS